MARHPLSSACFLLAAGSAAFAQCGTLWSQLSPASSPPARARHAMAGDTARGRVVLFGGTTTAGAFLGDTGEWDGSAGGGAGAWTMIPVSGPSPRFAHSMTYDSTRQRVVLFGGDLGPVDSNELWEWDGAMWVLRTPIGVRPSPRSGAALAYDASRQVVILFGGGVGGGCCFSDIWEWNSAQSTWTPIATIPSPVVFEAMAYDPALQEVILVFDFPTLSTYRRTGSEWLLATLMSPRTADNSLAYDSARQRLVTYSGMHTAEWDGSAIPNPAWTIRATDTPPNREGHAVAFDALRQRVILFGGRIGGVDTNQTWEWVGALGAPEITQWPVNATAAHGSPVVLSVSASGSGSLSYQWYRNGMALAPGGVYSGVNSPTLTFTASSAQSGSYSARVSNACGVTSSPEAQIRVPCYANCDLSTTPPILNVNDFQCFLQQYYIGCPSP